jgi:hypothetical protein
MATYNVSKTFRTHISKPADIEQEGKRIVFGNFGDKALKSWKAPEDGVWTFQHEVEGATHKYRMEYDLIVPEDGSGLTVMYYIMII